jgi:hypothetical protein
MVKGGPNSSGGSYMMISSQGAWMENFCLFGNFYLFPSFLYDRQDYRLRQVELFPSLRTAAHIPGRRALP